MTDTVSRKNGPGKNGRPWPTRLKRNMRYRLVIPIQRSVHPPEHTARGVAVGLAWGLTPTVGVQMIFVFVCWVLGRRLFKWDFSLIIALAWTWTTNVITLFPCYYLFYMTGQVMLGRFDDLAGYGEFMKLWGSNVAAESELGYWEWLWTYTVLLIKGWGLPMLIGCLPWATLGAWVGYFWSLRFVRRYRAARSRRRAEKAGSTAGAMDSQS
jgi:uncharacterized protein (DUF2062 family)